MASLTIGGITYGRDKAGIEKLKTDLHSQINKIQNRLKTDSNSYLTLRKTITENWRGQDRNVFLNKLEQDLTTLRRNVATYKTKIDTALDAAYRDFQADQNKFANKIK